MVNARLRLPLRSKLMVIAVLPLAALTLATLWTVNRSLTAQVQTRIRDDLRRASATLESMLAARSRTLEIETQTIAQDPKFFAVLTLPGRAGDPQVRATVAGVARDFDAITQSDLFEVFDSEGRAVASVGREGLREAGRLPLVREALSGRAGSGLVAEREVHYQASATPVFAGDRVVGALLLGSRIGGDLAEELRALTRSEVTFMVGTHPTASTLQRHDDRLTLLTAMPELLGQNGGLAAGTLGEVRTAEDVYLTLVRPLPQAPPGTRQVYAMQRSLNSETATLREIQTGLLLLGIVALVAAMLAGWVIADRIVAPVKQMVRGAEAMERGDYDYPLDVEREDEIGYLALRFRDMRQSQRDHVAGLEEATRVKAEFISLASHELRTPISVIKGFQELMSSEALGPVTGKQREALGAIQRSVASLARVAENATRMSQIESQGVTLDLERTEIDALIDESIEAARALAPGRSVRLAGWTDGPVPAMRLDRVRLGLALTHLITNGIRFTPDGGQVDVRAAWDGETLEIAVRDTGVGIPLDRQNSLFERGGVAHDVRHHHSSSTMEFNSAGLGLGLAIARGIVEAHGGRLTLESEPGRGSTFRMRLALEPADALGDVA